MREFNSISSFVAHLVAMQAAETLALHNALKKCATAIEKTAKTEIGTYQGDVGPFPGWVELADATKEDRVAQGYTENDPLLRSGELRDSIDKEITGLEACVWSTSDVMVYQELGTPNIPPRPVLGPAAIHNKELIEKTLGQAVVAGLLYGSGRALTSLE
jgi:HK97 gp10 family phage protein